MPATVRNSVIRLHGLQDRSAGEAPGALDLEQSLLDQSQAWVGKECDGNLLLALLTIIQTDGEEDEHKNVSSSDDG